MSTALRARPHRATWLALLLLVPLVHGAGAHLAAPTASGLVVAPAAADAVAHPGEEPCALCVASREVLERGAGEPVATTIASASDPVARIRDGAAPGPPRVRPDAPRAPPRHSA